MVLGVIGVGHLAGAMLAGLSRAGLSPKEILLSPRGHGPAQAAQGGYGLAFDNADLVRRCDMVLLAVRPKDAATAVTGLPWRAGQILISACAGVGSHDLAGAVGPARITRIMPVTAAAIGKSPTVLFPHQPEVAALLRHLGPVIPLEREDAFEVATVSAAVYGWAQVLVRQTADWSAAQGLSPDTARQLVARTFEAAGALVAEVPQDMSSLLQELITPGGITERGLQVMEAGRVPEVWEGACQAVLTKLQG